MRIHCLLDSVNLARLSTSCGAKTTGCYSVGADTQQF